jgi:hypothetical protein
VSRFLLVPLKEGVEPEAIERLLAASEPIWSELAAGPPRIAEDAYSWVGPGPPEHVSFTSTPGPGDSDGGDVYAPRAT